MWLPATRRAVRSWDRVREHLDEVNFILFLTVSWDRARPVYALGWVHRRPRPGSAGLIGAACAEGLTGSPGLAGDARILVVHSAPESLPECPSENLSERKG